MNLNLQAWELRRKLFNLVAEFKLLQQAAHNVNRGETASEIDGVACRLAELHDSLPEVFIDAARDPRDQSFKVNVPV